MAPMIQQLGHQDSFNSFEKDSYEFMETPFNSDMTNPDSYHLSHTNESYYRTECPDLDRSRQTRSRRCLQMQTWKTQ